MRRLADLQEDGDLGEAMGKKHFQRIADIIRPRAGKADVKEIAREMAAFFASENPQFDTARFLKAAGLHGASAGAIAASADEGVDDAFTRKHFVRVAEILKGFAPSPVAREIAALLADFFSDESPQFDKVRFLRAAGVSPSEVGAPAGDRGKMALAASADDDLDEAARPPKPWMDSCLARQKGNRKIRDAGAVCAEIWRGMGPEGQRRAKRAGTFEDSDVTEATQRTVVPWADDPEIGGMFR